MVVVFCINIFACVESVSSNILPLFSSLLLPSASFSFIRSPLNATTAKHICIASSRPSLSESVTDIKPCVKRLNSAKSCINAYNSGSVNDLSSLRDFTNVLQMASKFSLSSREFLILSKILSAW